MKIIRYVDMYKTFMDEEGGLHEVLIGKDYTIPVIIDKFGIGPISPYVGSNGRLFKNVSTLMYDNEPWKVVGNYNDLNDLKHNRVRIKGYYDTKQREKKIED